LLTNIGGTVALADDNAAAPDVWAAVATMVALSRDSVDGLANAVVVAVYNRLGLAYPAASESAIARVYSTEIPSVSADTSVIVHTG
jgi:hypothetical protein